MQTMLDRSRTTTLRRTVGGRSEVDVPGLKAIWRPHSPPPLGSDWWIWRTWISRSHWPEMRVFKKFEMLRRQGSEDSRGAWLQSGIVNATGCGFHPHSRKWNIYLNLYFHFFALVSRQRAALSSATEHAIPPEFSGMWRTECLNTRFHLPTLLYAGYSVKLIYLLKQRMHLK